jgi:hypothetical protein
MLRDKLLHSQGDQMSLLKISQNVAEPVFLSNMTLYKNVAQHFRLLWLF